MQLKQAASPLTLLGLFLLTTVAGASPLTFTSSDQFLSQLSGSPTVIDFNEVSGFWNTDASTGYLNSGVQFVGRQYGAGDSAGSPSLFNTYIWNSPGSAYDFGTGGNLETVDPYWSSGQQPYILVSIPTATNALGFDVMTYLPPHPGWSASYGAAVDIWVTDAVGTYYQRVSTFGKAANPPAFFGIINPEPILSVKIQAVQGITAIDNFSWGSANVVSSGGGTEPPPPAGETPEAATAIMIVTGLLFILFGKKRLPKLAV